LTKQIVEILIFVLYKNTPFLILSSRAGSMLALPPVALDAFSLPSLSSVSKDSFNLFKADVFLIISS
jgi:hypothetical protein